MKRTFMIDFISTFLYLFFREKLSLGDIFRRIIINLTVLL